MIDHRRRTGIYERKTYDDYLGDPDKSVDVGPNAQFLFFLAPQMIGNLVSNKTFPSGRDAEKVQRLIAHYESLDEDAQVAEDEAALEPKG